MTRRQANNLTVIQIAITCTMLCLALVSAFQFKLSNHRLLSSSRRSNSELKMVFDFIKKRSQEGIEQFQNIASKTLEGKLDEALRDTSDYVKTRQSIDRENFKSLLEGLSSSRVIFGGISGIFSTSSKDSTLDDKLEELEELLLRGDIGSVTSNTILKDVKKYIQENGGIEKMTDKNDDIMKILRLRLIEALSPPDINYNLNFVPRVESEEAHKPTVMLIIGANGVGKTTAIGKIATRFRIENNQSVIVGACDTFRPAAVEQLNQWTNRANVSIVTPSENEIAINNPYPVLERTLRRGKEEKFDVIIIDTSGRLSNNFDLIEQLQNIKKIIQKEIGLEAPHEILLVIDATIGRNAVDQAVAWKKYTGVSGLVVTKLDGTAKAGFVVSIVRDLVIPVKFIGVGERIEDLRLFQPEVFVDALLGLDSK